jgi:rod shape-determining protein MreC
MPIYTSDTNGSGKARSNAIAAGFFLLSAIALYSPDSSQDQVASLLRGSVLRPFVLVQEGIVRRSIHAEDTEVLQRQLDSLQAVIANTNTLSEENDRLRGLLELSERNPALYVAASATRSGTPGSESMFGIDVGTREGVERDSPVIVGGGLLGVVREVQASNAAAMDWTHPQFRASAMTADGVIYGIVQAAPGRFREADRLLLDGIPFHQELDSGAVIVTSGWGGVFPRGIRIGVVLEEADAREGWVRSYWLRPFVLPGEATHVQALVSGTVGAAEDLASGALDTEARTPQ